MTPAEIEELAALYAAGALDGAELLAFEKLLDDGDAAAQQTLAEFQDATAMMAAASVPSHGPSRRLKARIMERLNDVKKPEVESGDPKRTLASSRLSGFKFVPGDLSQGWHGMAAPGAYIKLLSYNHESRYAVVLGRLDPGSSYPPHHHSGAEEIYLLSGDLQLGEHVLHAGDFHHSDSGTSHDANHSVEGCTLLAVVSSTEVLAELGLVSSS